MDTTCHRVVGLPSLDVQTAWFPKLGKQHLSGNYSLKCILKFSTRQIQSSLSYSKSTQCLFKLITPTSSSDIYLATVAYGDRYTFPFLIVVLAAIYTLWDKWVFPTKNSAELCKLILLYVIPDFIFGIPGIVRLST
jgi:hypothetical protein